MPTTAAYGSWKSPITADLIVAQTITLADVRLDGSDIYWLEGRPQEQGRNVVVRAGADGAPAADVNLPPFNARTRAHEYGGGAWTVAGGTLYFSHFADGRLYRQTPGAGAPRPLTAAPARPNDWRFADGLVDAQRKRWIGVREDHTVQGLPQNTLVAVDLANPGAEAGRVLAHGHDFFSACARRDKARLARLGPAQHALGRHGALSGGARRRRHACGQAAGDCRRTDGIDLPARMVAGRDVARVRVRSVRVVESLPP
jgi:hypothetical protein